MPENKIIHTIVLFTLFLIILNVIQYSGFEIKTILTQLTFNIDFFDIAFHNFSYLFNFMIDGARLAEQIIRITFSGIYYISVVVIAMSLWKIANKNSLD